MRPLATKASDDPLLEALNQARASLAAGIAARKSPAQLLAGHAQAVDAVIRSAWSESMSGNGAALFATGGYGRRELYPGSDIDLAVILAEPTPSATSQGVERFVRRLWDLGLKVGSGVRTLGETHQAAADATIFTALTEARLLAGERRLARALDTLLTSPDLWPETTYLKAKRRERAERYARYDGTTQKLEPSVKEGPGGLRDLNTLHWLGARHLGRRRPTLTDLERAGLILVEERRALAHAARVLARIRLALHSLAGRSEDRLLFDLQPRAAELLGYRPRSGALAVEVMMQDYYRSAADIAHLNDLLFASLADERDEARTLTPEFLARGTALDFDHPDLPHENPRLLLGIFLHWQRDPHLRGLAPGAHRSIATALPLIDASFRRDADNRAAFLALFSAPNRVAAAMAAMHETGVLGRYLPAFARVAGRMQYDLFHVYTVDEHILRVLANVESLCHGRFEPARPDLRAAAARLDRPEVIFLAALFHDIAKGRGGDHSQLGAREARSFALDHGLARSDAELVGWLVQHHLALSVTAQKSDLSDPEVTAAFARLVGDQRRLDYLYVLTAADVHATNPALWNAWREALFGELYQRCSRALWRGLEHPTDAANEIAVRKREARALLGGGNSAVTRLWHRFGDDYFLRYTPEEISWHTRALLAAAGPPAVFLRAAPLGTGTAIAIYCTRESFAFARVTAVLAQLGLTIAAARCVPIGDEATLDTYLVFEADGSPIEDPRRIERTETSLMEELERDSATPHRVIRPTPRQVRLFRTPTRISFSKDPESRYDVLELHAGDHPGLLAAVARAFKHGKIQLRAARVMTIGERAEDVFHITDADGRSLDATTRTALESALHTEIADEV
ncbi:MAG: [protein-PII] uridylyltransferase [Gammaproteobacteria bacterium]